MCMSASTVASVVSDQQATFSLEKLMFVAPSCGCVCFKRWLKM